MMTKSQAQEVINSMKVIRNFGMDWNFQPTELGKTLDWETLRKVEAEAEKLLVDREVEFVKGVSGK